MSLGLDIPVRTELCVSNQDAVKLWEALEEAGAELGIKPCGLGARDTLRLEMSMRSTEMTSTLSTTLSKQDWAGL